MARMNGRTMMVCDGESGDEVIDDRIEEDSAYVHGRRLVLSVADEQTALGRCW